MDMELRLDGHGLFQQWGELFEVLHFAASGRRGSDGPSSVAVDKYTDVITSWN